MYREPLFMYDLHKRQSKEYEQNKRLNLHQFVEYINTQARKSEDRRKLENRDSA